MKYQSTKNVTINPVGNGRPVILNVGQVVTQSQLMKLTDRQIESYLTPVVRGRRVVSQWTQDEMVLLGCLYNEMSDPSNGSDNRDNIIIKFRDKFDTHSDDAVVFMICQAKCIDNLYDAGGFTSLNHKFVNILNNIDHDRYVSVEDVKCGESLV